MEVEVKDILDAIFLLTDLLPILRDRLGLTQKEFASVIGISRQSVIELEHKRHKITKAVFISMVAFFSLRRETARLLYDKGFYNMKYIGYLGFSDFLIEKIYAVKHNG